QQVFSAVSVSDARTKETIKNVYQHHQYLLDPHGAVGFTALSDYLNMHPDSKGIVVETAHPVKFFDVVEPVIGEAIKIPETIQSQLGQQKNATLMNAYVNALKNFLHQL
ncbi:MAG: threonine synthase, partial [Bacteroidetes bacterium]|nr:threonine synthase [Bacteroidota bacterium]